MKTTLATLLLLTVVLGSANAASDRINVTDYGATPNDGTDDTSAINSAVAAGKSIYFPPGSYNYSGAISVPSNQSYRFYGDGPGVSTILFTGPSAGIHALSGGSSTLNVDGLTLEALTTSAGSAIYGSFSNPNNKFHTVTIHNVEIRGNTETGSTGGYWGAGINLVRAQNCVIDKVDITGNAGVTVAGIEWASPTTIATTGIQITNVQIKFCNTAILTTGWVEGFYMSGFEIVDNGAGGSPSLDLKSTRPDAMGTEFHLVNGEMETLGDGLRMTNLSGIYVDNVGLYHAIDGTTYHDSSILALTNCARAFISGCGFFSGTSPAPANENGVYLTNATNVHISGNTFSNIKPTSSGSCIVALSGNTVRVTDNIFENVRNAVDNRIGTAFYYDPDDNIVK